MQTLQAIACIAMAGGAWSATVATVHDDAHTAPQHAEDASKVQERAFGKEGDPKKVRRAVRLDMTDGFRFTPSDIAIKRGETVKFVVSNCGKLLHEMVLGTTQELKAHAEMMRKFHDIEHADGSRVHVEPGARGEIVWHFIKAGEYQFAYLIPGHFEAGMVGKVVVR